VIRAWVLLGGVFLGAFGGVVGGWANQSEVMTSHDSSASLYRSVGRILLPVDLKVATSVILDFSEYSKWALDDINGDDANSQKFIALLRGMEFLVTPEKNSKDAPEEGVFDVFYDVDLIWPFGSKNNRVQLKVRGLERDSLGQVKRLRMELAQSTLVLSSFFVLFEVKADTDRKAWVDFQCETQFAGWIDTFFSVERYKRNIEWRLMKLMRNLAARTEGKAGISKKEVAGSEKLMAD
jgi:hypothetical protein